MKYFLALSFLLFAPRLFAQQITYQQFVEDAKTKINLQPEYGNVPKPKDMQQEDNTFIAEAIKADTTMQKASDHMVRLGFSYLYRGDMETAMKRFNQAWLLNPKNENVYWGYGAVYGTFGDYPSAIVQLDKGLIINPNSSVILTDKATLYFIQYQQDQDQTKLNTALGLLNKSYSIDANNVNTTYKLSICYFLDKDCGNAWKFYDISQKLGGQPIAKNYTEALKKACAR
jgi:tetratricopeptide (TPR) repeat protein